jgi:hypothetical protein
MSRYFNEINSNNIILTTGTVSNLTCSTGTVSNLTSTTGTVSNLTSTTGTVSNLTSTTGTISSLYLGSTIRTQVNNFTMYSSGTNGAGWYNVQASVADAKTVLNSINENNVVLGPSAAFISASSYVWFMSRQGGVNYSHITTAGSVIPFTVQHLNFSNSIEINEVNNLIGLIVVSTGHYKQINRLIKSGPLVDYINVNDALPIIELSSYRNQKSAWGVITNWDNQATILYDENDNLYTDNSESGWGNTDTNDRIRINGGGEGGIWICNINGNFENGDLITTCEIPGYGMLQDDDLIRNYTVGKITCDCDFDLASDIYVCEQFTHEGVRLKRALVGCIYLT